MSQTIELNESTLLTLTDSRIHDKKPAALSIYTLDVYCLVNFKIYTVDLVNSSPETDL